MSFKLRFSEGCEPAYMTELSAGADLRAREDRTIEPGKVVAVPAGVWIEEYLSESNDSAVFELQIRARSSLAFKHGIMLANGVGTVDADYPNEIGVLLYNSGDKAFEINKGERIAQMIVAKCQRIETLPVGGKRKGGFGSTGRSSEITTNA